MGAICERRYVRMLRNIICHATKLQPLVSGSYEVFNLMANSPVVQPMTTLTDRFEDALTYTTVEHHNSSPQAGSSSLQAGSSSEGEGDTGSSSFGGNISSGGSSSGGDISKQEAL